MAKAQQATKSSKGPDFFSKVAGLKKQVKIVILVLSLVGLSAFFYTTYYTPWEQQVVTLTTEIATLANTARTEQNAIDKHKPIVEYIVPVNNTYNYLKNFLTTENEIPRLIQIISDLGARSGAQVTLFAPKAAIPRADYAEIQFTMNLEGPFLNVLKFFYSLSQMDRLINITSVNMAQPRLIDNNIMILSVSCEGSTYRLLTPEESEAAGKK
ncbi:MAG: type 4a pilus biogenesis protein PilO [Deltaproteobacteria bacterium]|jgi:Tfp pilus assembly protein PilO|nr:type 4a pilus biogenesis protein PilO [Deltaproteobacteria bacterium]